MKMTIVSKGLFWLQYMLGWMAIFVIGPLYFVVLKAMGYRVRDLKKLRREFALQIKKHEGPWIICANHLTMVDSLILVYATTSLDAHLRHYQMIPWNLPEQDNFQRNILLSIFCYLGKCIPINRGGDPEKMKKTLDKCADVLSRKQNLMIFPEGTRSRTGRVNTENFSYGVGRFIKDFPDCKVICLYLRGDGQDSYGTIPKFGEYFTMLMSVLEPIRTEDSGPRAWRYYAEQVIKSLARMEEDYFVLRRLNKLKTQGGEYERLYRR